ncbi:hypothetical protein [Saccharopolyspora spinosa]|uniref:hypothetical protein n=1 Tax=Saccharopolyspora spinosa TaxID=60894 RepID=UPI00376F399D
MSSSIIDDQPYGRFHRKLFFLSAGGPFLDGYILSVIGVAITGATRELGLTSSPRAWSVPRRWSACWSAVSCSVG